MVTSALKYKAVDEVQIGILKQLKQNGHIKMTSKKSVDGPKESDKLLRTYWKTCKENGQLWVENQLLKNQLKRAMAAIEHMLEQQDGKCLIPYSTIRSLDVSKKRVLERTVTSAGLLYSLRMVVTN